MRLKETHQFLRAEISQNEIADDEGGGEALAREVDHGRISLGIGQYVNFFVLEASLIQICFSINAPGATRFNVET